MRKLLVSPSPHIHSPENTRRLMRDVLIALSPSVLISLYYFGFSALQVLLVSVIGCMGVEYLIEKFLLKSKNTISDGSAAVTGVLLALNLPPATPWWVVLIGTIVAIGIAKMTFGGLGQNIFNPALVGRVFLLVSFPVIMTSWGVSSSSSWFHLDGFSGATPLSLINEGLAAGQTVPEIMAAHPEFSSWHSLFARVGGSMGEVSVIALLLGFIYLLIRKVIRPHITLTIWITVLVMSGIFWLADKNLYPSPLFTLLTGGLLLGSIFMATDYVTSPMNTKGQIIFGVGIGVITVLIRYFGSYPEGMSFAILIMNSVVPLLNKIKPARFGKEVVNG